VNPFDQAWSLLKGIAPMEDDAIPPNYEEIKDPDDFSEAEAAWQSRYAPVKVTPPVSRLEQSQARPPLELPPSFWDGHAHERVTDKDRVVDENESQEVRDRVTNAIRPLLDEYGMYKLDSPRSLAIRTHLLNEDRRPDEAQAMSNGNSIVAIVHPDKNNKLRPKLKTVMLRRSELHPNEPQPFKAKNLRVDKVINNHGLSKRAFKQLVAQSKRRRFNVRTGEPMDIAFQFLKEEDWERYGLEQPPWSALNPAPINTYDEEIEALENAGDTEQARRFVGVKNALAWPDKIRQSAIERFGVPISQALSPEWDDDEHMSAASDFYNQGRSASDFADIRNYSPEQQAIMRAEMKKLLAQKKRVGQHQERAEELENQLRIDDPTKFFADKERPFRDPSSQSRPWDKFLNEPKVRPGDVVR